MGVRCRTVQHLGMQRCQRFLEKFPSPLISGMLGIKRPIDRTPPSPFHSPFQSSRLTFLIPSPSMLLNQAGGERRAKVTAHETNGEPSTASDACGRR